MHLVKEHTAISLEAVVLFGTYFRQIWHTRAITLCYITRDNANVIHHY